MTRLISRVTGASLLVFAGLLPHAESADRSVASSEPLLSVPVSKGLLHISVPIRNQFQVAPAAAWQLVEDDRSDVVVVAQVSSLPAEDGTTDPSGNQSIAAIPSSDHPQLQRRFRLQSGRPNEPDQSSFQFEQVRQVSLGLRQGDRPVLTYNFGTIINHEVPNSDHRGRRACYIHPLWGLNHEILTADFPKDHYHHHGLFWAWPHVGVAEQQYDLWMYRDIEQRFVRWICREAGPVAAILAVENGWYVGDEQVMIERVWLRVFRASDTEQIIDLALFLIPTKNAVTLQGAAGKSYGGLTLRFAPAARQHTRIAVPNGLAEQDLPDTRLAWADFTSQFGDTASPSGATLMVHPNHPNFPPTWLTRHYGPLCVGWPGVQPKTLPPGKPVQLNYRIRIHKAALELEDLQQGFENYVAATSVQWTSSR